MEQEFKYLFTPLKIGNVTVPNRILLTGAEAGYYPGESEPSERAINYFQARAKGGIGLIVTSAHYVCWPTTLNLPTAYESDTVIPALKRLADAIHGYGTKVFGQLIHESRQNSRVMGGGSMLSASAIPRTEPIYFASTEIPHEVDTDDIRRIVNSYGTAAARFKEAGYDGVEIRAVFGMFQASFLSPVMNQRTDQYGGSLENRMRLLLETIDAIRDNVGLDFVVGVRFTGDEFLDGGLTLDDTKEIARGLEATGKVDYLFPCATAFGPAHLPSMYYPLAAFAYIPAGIKEVVNLPVFSVGRINDPILAETILANHQADMVGMTRATMCDPEMPTKAQEGRLDEIRRCIGCNEGCIEKLWQALPVSCSINPELGREKELAITPAGKKKRVMVIGGGAAGLETARVAALRGHKVSLYEKNDVLAKELSIAAKSPRREGFEDAVRYYTYQMKLLGVDVHLGVTITPEMVVKENPDAVVVATGAVPFIPNIPGADADNVVEMRQVLQEQVEVGQNVIVADCQLHIYGMDVADFLADKGKKVELLTQAIFAGGQLDWSTLQTLYTMLLSKGVTITPLTKVKEIRGNTVIAYNELTGAERQIEGIDTVVFCTDGKADDSLYRFLKGKVRELYEVGQCVSPRKLLDSVYDAALVGRTL